VKNLDLIGKSFSELKDELHSLLKVQFGLRMQHGTRRLNDTSQVKKVRRQLARIKTLMTKVKTNDV
jgi:large subunit ribosomal protein L29